MLLVLVIMAYAAPTLWLISTSLKREDNVFSRQVQWIPRPITFENYKEAFLRYPLLNWLKNSAIVAALVVICSLLLNIPAGYVFARHRFFGDRVFFAICLLSMMVPIHTYLVPLYLFFGRLGLLNRYGSLAIPLLSNGFGVFLVSQFVKQIPIELEEAALIDGASHWRILTQIITPLCKPAISTLVIFRFIAAWNDFAWPIVAASSDRIKTQTVGLAIHIFAPIAGSTQAPPRYALTMAASLIVTLPTIIVFLFLQRYFIQGLATSGLK